jgi:translation initiation factor eIF-2B subunit beta
MATAHLLLLVVSKFKWTRTTDIADLLTRIKDVGLRLIKAQPREMAVGNIVRRVLGMIRDEAKEERDDTNDSAASSQIGSPQLRHSEMASSKTDGVPASFSPLRYESTDTTLAMEELNGDDTSEPKATGPRPPLMTSHTSYAVFNGVPVQQSMFNLFSATPSPSATPPGTGSPHGGQPLINAASLAHKITSIDLKAEITIGIGEIIDELDQVDDQIAAYAQEHIHANEVILTHSSSRTVQKFLLKAAEKRKFTVVVAESYPNDHEATHRAVTGRILQDHEGDDEMRTENFLKPLTAAGVTIILMTDASIFAIMSRVNKVILATHAVIANGGLIAAAGARIIAKAAKVHRTPVIVVSGVYKLSPEYPFEFESLIEYGDPGTIVGYGDGTLVDNLEVDNPLFDYVPPDMVDLYITNLWVSRHHSG